MPAELVPQAANGMAIAAVTYPQHFAVLRQFFLSLTFNLQDALSSAFLIVTSASSEVAGLQGAFVSELSLRVLKLHICGFQTVVDTVSPGTIAKVDRLPMDASMSHHRGSYGTFYICMKKAFAARFALTQMGAERVLVTDSEAYLWKPIRLQDLISGERAKVVWYADPGVTMKPGDVMFTTYRRRNFCSIHPWAANTSVRWAKEERSFVAGRSWSSWRELTAQMFPGPKGDVGADFFTDMLFIYAREHFEHYWRIIENHWGAPFLDAVLRGLVSLKSRKCHADSFFFEVSYRSFLQYHHPERYQFRNMTLALRGISRRLGKTVLSTSHLWMLVTNKQVSAFLRFYGNGSNAASLREADSGNHRLSATGRNHASLQSGFPKCHHASMRGTRSSVAALEAFRYDYRKLGKAKGSCDEACRAGWPDICAGVKVIRHTEPPAAVLQLNSAVPNWVFTECREHLPTPNLPSVRHNVTTR